MIKLFSLKQQKRDGEAGKSGTKRASAAQLRIQKGTADMVVISIFVSFSFASNSVWTKEDVVAYYCFCGLGPSLVKKE